MSSSVCLFSNRCQMTSKYGKNTFWQLRYYSVELRQYESILFIDRKAKCSYLWRQPCVWPLIDVKEKPIKMMSVYCSICEYESDLCSNEHYLSSYSENKAWKKFRHVRGLNFIIFFLFVIFRPSFHYCSSSVHYCEDHFHITSLSTVHIYDFYIFTVISAYHIINYLPCMWLIYGLKHSKLRFYTRLNLYIEL